MNIERALKFLNHSPNGHMLFLASTSGILEFEQIPAEWQEWLEQETEFVVLELAKALLDQPSQVPRSLLDWSNTARQLQLNRTPVGPETIISKQEASLSRMGMKKLHEVKRMVDLIVDLGNQHSIDVIIDMGAGHGYLTQELANHFPIVGIECDWVRTCAAQRRSQQMPSKYEIVYIQEMIQDNMEQLFQKPEMLKFKDKRFLLCGLHCCGDLSGRYMIDWFNNNPQIHVLCVVSCCYHLMDPDLIPRSIQGLKCTTKELRMSCHCFNDFDTQRLTRFWKRQAFRAQAQHMCDLNETRDVGKDASKAKDLTSYLKAVAKPVVREPLIDVDTVYKRVALFAFINSRLGPIYESLLLLDRQGSTRGNPRLIPLFDPLISPRNVCLVSHKGSS
ncbi:methyltransferase domain-containing protein [Gorgonomyces haynaldii]|nr:methyltransferase domain-containing protein [Gorgonomyces haynaldii]